VKEFFKYLQSGHVDGVVVAGGNGTVLEVGISFGYIVKWAFFMSRQFGEMNTNRYTENWCVKL